MAWVYSKARQHSPLFFFFFFFFFFKMGVLKHSGGSWLREILSPPHHPTPLHLYQNTSFLYCTYFDPPPPHHTHIPHYSTDIPHSFQVFLASLLTWTAAHREAERSSHQNERAFCFLADAFLLS
ncbi:hypothetical protein IWX47DRAFT_9262 [Phyllosticta citricarpa]